MPGYKITMLPDDVVHIYTLDEGRSNPAVSLYVQINEETLETVSSETRLERVPVEVNFRYDKLDHIVTEEWLTDLNRG
jgi:exoribonuclease-2